MGTEKETSRVCDFCEEGKAILYCRADSAKLCLSCDRQVHSTNQLFTKHTRWLLCDTCDSSPVSIFCSTDKSVFCQNCDWEAHKLGPSSSGLHDRRPLDGFSGCPSVAEFLAILGFDGVDKKTLFLVGDNDDDSGYNGNCDHSSEGDLGFLDLSTWDCPSIVSVNDVKASNDFPCGHSFQAMGVPPLPKNRNAACGQHKDEILKQLREMSKSEPISDDCVNLIEFQSLVPKENSYFNDKDEDLESNHEVNAYPWSNNVGDITDETFPTTLVDSFAIPEKDLNTENIEIIPKIVVREINSQERVSAITRYKEKKKTRRYEKHIRYESRKVRAESRTRIKGRFAKMGPRQPVSDGL